MSRPLGQAPADNVNGSETRTAPGLRVLHFRRAFSLFTESFIYQPIQMMVRRGVKARVMCVVRYREGNENLPTSSIVRASSHMQGGTFLRQLLGALFRMSQPDMLLWPCMRLFLRKPAETFKPDLLHAHFGPDGCLVTPIAKEYNIPLVVSFYGYDVSRLFKNPKSAWPGRYRKMFKHASAAVAISKHVANQLRDAGIPDEKIHVIRLGIHVNKFAPKEHAPVHNEGNSVRCLFIGRLTQKKGPLQLIRAIHKARQLLGDRIDLHLMIAGDGELRHHCKREIERLELDEYVHMLGTVPHSRIPQVLAETDIYTQHSVTGPDGDMEGLGVTFMEASAAGLPIVATKHDGIPEIVLDGETGLLSPENDIDAMAKNIVRLAESPRLRAEMGGRGRVHAEANFTIEQTISQTMDLYHKVLGRPKAEAGIPEISVFANHESIAANAPGVSS